MLDVINLLASVENPAAPVDSAVTLLKWISSASAPVLFCAALFVLHRGIVVFGREKLEAERQRDQYKAERDEWQKLAMRLSEAVRSTANVNERAIRAVETTSAAFRQAPDIADPGGPQTKKE